MSISQALGNPGRTATFRGVTYSDELVIDITDAGDIEDVLGIEVHQIKPFKARHMHALLWAVVRKGDPGLTDDEKRKCRYRLDFHDFGRTVTLADLQTAEIVSFLVAILKASRMIPDERPGAATGEDAEQSAEGDSGNATGEAAAAESR